MLLLMVFDRKNGDGPVKKGFHHMGSAERSGFNKSCVSGLTLQVDGGSVILTIQQI